ncbi:MAG: hypothetical protein PSV22_14385 [Pseudolabrys sp.]|nr:hypothetical protein [Pseudolabrys sp.]
MGTVIERPKRRKKGGEGAGVDLLYTLKGYSDETAAETALLAGSPGTYTGLIRKSWSIDELGSNNWEATVTYSKAGPLQSQTKDPPETGYSEFAFDLKGGTQHIQQSIATASYAAAGVVPDFKFAIGISRNGNSISVDGCDVVVPEFAYSETHYISAASVTNAYVQALKSLTGKTNDSPFKGFAIGEVLFLGASGSQRGSSDWRIDFSFKISENVTGKTIGDITGIDKPGHAYLWVLSEDVEDTAAKTLVRRPSAVYVEQVYESADFSLLGIGT